MNEADRNEQTLRLDEAIALGINLHRSGQLAGAESLYRQIMEAVPEQPDVLHFLGLLLHQTGRSDEGLDLIRRSLAVAPDHVDALNNFGNVLKEKGHLDEAEAAFTKAITLAPNHVGAHNNLGVVLREQGRLDEAVAAYAQTILLQSDYLDAHANLGHALSELGRFSEAATAYQKMVTLAPNHAGAHFQLGRIHRRQNRKADAVASFRQAITLQPQHAAAHFQLGNTLVEGGLLQDADEAMAAYRLAIKCDSRFSKAYENLGNLLNLLGRGDEAALIWQQWLNHNPDHPIARHMAVATSGLQPGRAEDGYVTEIFDDFASVFDERLRQLHYRAPELVGEEFARELGRPAGDLSVLDAGCGTGLCGPWLRPYARRLEGVDLSTGMLDQARARGCYDELVSAELTAFLTRMAGSYDAIACADTLVYFGDLEPVLRAVCHALRPGGRFVFTLERSESSDGIDGIHIHALGRYTHSEEYVRKIFAGGALSVRRIVRADLRMEGGKPVGGFVVVARKILTEQGGSSD